MTLLEHIDLAIAVARANLDESMEAVLQRIRQMAEALPPSLNDPQPPAPPTPAETPIDPPDPARQLRDNEQLFQPAQPSLPGV